MKNEELWIYDFGFEILDLKRVFGMKMNEELFNSAKSEKYCEINQL